MKYYSQDSQDRLIDIFLDRAENGFFVDIGAHNGIKFSNSYFFEKNRNWSGICVEPMPEVFEELKQNRSCHLVNGVVSNYSGSLEFRRIKGRGDMLSGIAKHQSEQHKQRMVEKVEEVGSELEILEVSSHTLSEILKKYEVKRINYLSIDVEGAEVDVISSLDFSQYVIEYMTIENNYDSNSLRDLIVSNNYKFVFRHGSDDFYVHADTFNYGLLLKASIFKIWLKYNFKRIFNLR